MAEPTSSWLPRFTLVGLLEMVSGMAIFLALVTQLETYGFMIAAIGLLALLAVDHWLSGERESGARRVAICLAAVMFMILSAAIVMPAANEAREGGRRSQCNGHLCQLVLAMHNYHDVHGHWPPAYVADAQGRPMHSWRVLILPYIEEQALFQAYDMDEPWNGPNNSKLAARMPRAFRCPSDDVLPPGMTSYFCITGPGRSKEGEPNLKFEHITDGTGHTIALVESCSARVNWLDPRDLTVEDMLSGQNTAAAPCACSFHGRSERGLLRSSGGFYAALFDGSRRFIPASPANLDPAQLRALLTIDGGERLDLENLRFANDSHIWPGVWVLLAAEAVFLIFAITRRALLARRASPCVSGGVADD